MNNKTPPVLIFCIGIILMLTLLLYPEEGMIPLSEIHKLDLDTLGFDLSPHEVYNPNGISLVDGIINLNGCTASFISADGLLLTNYHCAFRAIQSVTTMENDYMEQGFIAKNRNQEIPTPDYTVRVIEFYKDVSPEVLKVIKKRMSATQRTKVIDKKKKEIELQVEKKYPGRRAEVAEMFMGKTYVLFVYKYIQDIRLVYAPPRTIGEFGGEEDNWMWPRHTGDFTIMRAYVGPLGTYSKYSPDNIPFHPKKYLPIAPQGINEEEMVFILGYPGRTYRHRTSYFLAYEETFKKPYLVSLYQWMIQKLEKLSQTNRLIEIKLSAKLDSLWNRMKRYKGQLKGMKNLQLVKKRKQQEDQLQLYIESKPHLKKRYGHVLEKLKTLYLQKQKDAPYELLLDSFLKSSNLLNNAYKIYEASIERKKKNTERETDYMDKNFDRTRQRMKRDLKNFHQTSDQIFLKNMLLRVIKLEKTSDPLFALIVNIIKKFNCLSKPTSESIKDTNNTSNMEKAIEKYLKKIFSETKLENEAYMMKLLKKSTKELDNENEPFIQLAKALYPIYLKQKEKEEQQEGLLNELLPLLIEMKQLMADQVFIPDANNTLRLTYGRIRGYSPADAIYYKPFTTINGLIEKNTGTFPFHTPEKTIDLYDKQEFGQFIHPQLKTIPVNILYNTDTTGGNSGSPVLNSKGQLVGLNFDRVYEATINDYAWDESYSRSIGVDIRYILWLLEKFAGASHLLNEMKVSNKIQN